MDTCEFLLLGEHDSNGRSSIGEGHLVILFYILQQNMFCSKKLIPNYQVSLDWLYGTVIYVEA